MNSQLYARADVLGISPPGLFIASPIAANTDEDCKALCRSVKAIDAIDVALNNSGSGDYWGRSNISEDWGFLQARASYDDVMRYIASIPTADILDASVWEYFGQENTLRLTPTIFSRLILPALPETLRKIVVFTPLAIAESKVRGMRYNGLAQYYRNHQLGLALERMARCLTSSVMIKLVERIASEALNEDIDMRDIANYAVCQWSGESGFLNTHKAGRVWKKVADAPNANRILVSALGRDISSSMYVYRGIGAESGFGVEVTDFVTLAVLRSPVQSHMYEATLRKIIKLARSRLPEYKAV